MTRNLSLTIFAALFMSSFIAAQPPSKGTPITTFTETNRKEAQSLWELAVAAKGGREKLKSVRNMVEIQDAIAGWSLFRTFKTHMVTVSEFPWRWWRWDDQRPSVFGLSESMYDDESGKMYSFNPENNSGTTSLEDFGTVSVGKKGAKLNGLITSLLVTSWTEPTVLGMYSEGRSDVIRTELNGGLIDFALDGKTHLPKWWKAYRDDGLPPNSWWQKDYKDFDGIVMATHDGPSDESGRNTTTYQFNVEIDPSIWKEHPPYQLGENGWRKRP